MENASKEKAREIARIVNDFSFNPTKIAWELQREHRTLQQSFTSLCIEWLRLCASEEYRYDGRNELSHIVAKELIDGHDVGRLPLI